MPKTVTKVSHLKSRLLKQCKITQSRCKRLNLISSSSFNVPVVLLNLSSQFSYNSENVNLSTSLYFGAKSEFMIASQIFSLFLLAKCGLEQCTELTLSGVLCAQVKFGKPQSRQKFKVYLGLFCFSNIVPGFLFRQLWGNLKSRGKMLQ